MPRAVVRFRPSGRAPAVIRPIGLKLAFHDDVYHSLIVRPWWQFFLFVASVILLINGLFAGLFLLVPGSVVSATGTSITLVNAFFFSVETMCTIGYGEMYPGNLYGHVVMTLEAITGLLVTAMVTGLTFAKFARPTARVLFCERPVVTPRNGVPHLVFRVANARHNLIAEAQCRLFILQLERTAEGDVLRRPVDLPLVRNSTPFFSMTWMVMHKIDEASPLFGTDALDRLRTSNAELFLVLSGHDDTLGQTIHARANYRFDAIAWGHRFVDVLHVADDGTRTIDYRSFHHIEPIGTSE